MVLARRFGKNCDKLKSRVRAEKFERGQDILSQLHNIVKLTRMQRTKTLNKWEGRTE